MKKFKLTTNTRVNELGITLFQIECTVAIEKQGVEVGDLGGWIESEDVDGDARVSDNAWVSGNAQVSGDARVGDNAWVGGNARVSGDARVCGNAQVSGNARVRGDTQVCGNARVCGNALVFSDNDHCEFQSFGNVGRTTTAHQDSNIGVRVNCGCFSGSLDAFLEKVQETHGDNIHGRTYRAIAEVIKLKFGID